MNKRTFYENLDVNVVVFGEEKCPKTGKDHLQGHVTFKRAYRLSALKKLSNAHWEVALATDYNYELKGENVFIKDNRKKKGLRTDLENVAGRVADGATIREIAEEFPGQYIRYHRGIERLMEVTQLRFEKANYDLESCCKRLQLGVCEDYTNVIIGRPGCGKTQYALAHFKNPILISHMDDLLGFNNKNDGIVFDDMDFRHMPRTAQIHLTDYDNTRSIHCRYKTATIPAKTYKIFTCNEYPFTEDDAIRRRVTVTEVRER